MTRLLVVEHGADGPPDRVGEALSAAGCTLDGRRPYDGDALPADLHEHDAMLVLGGAMDAEADASYPWLSPDPPLSGYCATPSGRAGGAADARWTTSTQSRRRLASTSVWCRSRRRPSVDQG